MAKKLRPGDTVNGYSVVQLINNGANALSYEATSGAAKERVFFKQYKSPSVTVPWYRAYVNYQQELKRRVENNRTKHFCYKFLDFFEAEWGSQCYFQVFEFVEKGHDLGEILDRVRAKPKAISWEQRLILAKVLLAGVNALHEAKIVHCDLKPPNIQLFHDESIEAGYQLKLIDMDFSILSDRPAPWHGQMGYVGSPRYFSPEHLEPGAVPREASDVFTCGLILYELLADGHPYWTEEDDEYLRAVRGYEAPPPKLVGSMPAPARDADVAALLHRCLSPWPSDRPTAREANLVLNGRAPLPPAPPRPRETARVTPPDPALDPSPPPAAGPPGAPGAQLELVGPAGQSLKFGIPTKVGKHLCQRFGPDAIFFDELQFSVDREPGGQWVVRPNPAARNETLLNGRALAAPAPLHEGDVLAVGRESKGVAKLPMVVRLVP